MKVLSRNLVSRPAVALLLFMAACMAKTDPDTTNRQASGEEDGRRGEGGGAGERLTGAGGGAGAAERPAGAGGNAWGPRPSGSHAGGQSSGDELAGGATGGDAGAASRGSGGGSSPETPRTIDCRGLALCEDFEGLPEGPLGQSDFAITGGTSEHYQVTRDDSHDGTQSLAVIIDSAAGRTRFLEAVGVDARTDGGRSVFARVWMKFPELPPVSRAEKAPHYRLIRYFQLVPGNIGVFLSAGAVGHARGRMLYFRPHMFLDCAADGVSLMANRWSCLELRVDQNGFEAWIDGQSIGGRGAGNGDVCWQKPDKVTKVAFGFDVAAGDIDKPFKFYMDDLAVATTRIGCD